MILLSAVSRPGSSGHEPPRSVSGVGTGGSVVAYPMATVAPRLCSGTPQHSTGPTVKRILLLIVIFFAAGCGDAGLLDGLGDRSVELVHGERSSTTTTTEPDQEAAPIGSVRSSDLIWYNDGLPGESTSNETAVVVSAVWQRGDGTTSVIQASRSEIAVALPGIQFPELIPDTVGWVTSQLVYDVASGTLDPETITQFGLWHREPYSTDGGRTALMRARPARPSDPIGEIRPETTGDGIDLSWVAESYFYVLSCPSELVEDLCWQMAESAMPLRLILPEPETP